jgi:hypothetical protein
VTDSRSNLPAEIKPGQFSMVFEDVLEVVRRPAFDTRTPSLTRSAGRPVRRSATNVRFGSIAWRLFADQR